MKYICITGGVISGIGKGTVSGSIGAMLRARGYKVTFMKIDPYLNYNAGLMSPSEHGEVYVLDDGCEADLDLGNYERFAGVTLSQANVMTSGKLFYNVIKKEKNGDYSGKTIQCNPHLIDEMIHSLENVANIPVKDFGSKEEPGMPEITLVELGGTVGDFESLIFTEALAKFSYKIPKDDILFISVEYLIELKSGEQKTKPLQTSYKTFRSFGLRNDIIICRCQGNVDNETKTKISRNCYVPEENIYHLPTLSSVYSVPEYLESIGLYGNICNLLDLEKRKKVYELSSKFGHLIEKYNVNVRIAIVSKYRETLDSYVSVEAALKFSAASLKTEIEFVWLDAEDLEAGEEASLKALGSVDCILVPGGFGIRGIEGKVRAINYARLNSVPFLGICLGFQLTIIEFCRNVLGIKDATSTEFNVKSKNPVVKLIAAREGKIAEGELRLGVNEICIEQGTLVGKIYNKDVIRERHRHRYEINPEYFERIESHGMLKLVGRGKDTGVAEILESKDHAYYVGAQFHPEFTARPTEPQPLFTGLIAAALSQKYKD